MASDLERLVADLRAIAAEAVALRPDLVEHARTVRRFAAEVAAPPGRTVPRDNAVGLLELAGRQCEELAADLAAAERAADHFARRVQSSASD